MDNRITDAAKAYEGQKIWKMIFLLRKPAEWAALNTVDERYMTFKRYENLQRKFFERFTNVNLSGTALPRLLQLKQECTRIQKYMLKLLTLAYKSQIGNQGVKAYIFNRQSYKKQAYVMLTNV